jgi:hypothetical protein
MLRLLILAALLLLPRPALAQLTIIDDNFRGILTTLPTGIRKLYPDTRNWAFTFWPGTVWPDSYGDGTNWLAGNFECQTYVTPFIQRVNGNIIPNVLRYDPFTIQSDGLRIRASLLNARQQTAYGVGGCRRFGSGMLLSRQNFQYGKITIVAKLPKARGTWPAFWMLPTSRTWPPEIDIMEGMAWGPHTQQLHSGLLPAAADGPSDVTWYDIGRNPGDDFNEYGLDWNEKTISMTFNGRKLWEKPTPPSMKQPMYLIINLAVGGKWVFNELGIQPIDGTSNERLIRGANMIQADFPADLIIRSVRVIQP